MEWEMQMSTVDIDKLKDLSPAEKILLVQTLWDSLVDSGEPVGLTDAQRDELDRRLQKHRENPDAGSTWEEVKDRIKGAE
jgi:putative addiction module component (TIGR02574 family)